MDIYVKEVESIDELLKELERQKCGQTSRDNWYCPSWSDCYTILIEGQLGEVVSISNEGEKENYIENIKNNTDNIFVEPLNFFVIKKHYIEGEDRDELSYYIIYEKGYLEVALHFLINRIISPVYQSKINKKNRIIKGLKKQLQK